MFQFGKFSSPKKKFMLNKKKINAVKLFYRKIKENKIT